MKLSDPSLFRQQCYLNGQWLDAASGLSIPVLNPATQKSLGTSPSLNTEEVRRAIHAAHQAQAAWQTKTAKERAVILSAASLT